MAGERWAAPGFTLRAAVPDPVLLCGTPVSKLPRAKLPPCSFLFLRTRSPLGAAEELEADAHGQTPHPGPLVCPLDPCFAVQVNISCWVPCTQDPTDQKLPPPTNKTLPQPERYESLHTPGRSPSVTDSVHRPRSLSPHTNHTRPQSKFRFPGACAHTQYTCHPEMISTLSSKTQPCASSSFVRLPGTPDPSQLQLLRSSSPCKGRVPASEQGSDTDDSRLCFHFKYTFRQLMPP